MDELFKHRTKDQQQGTHGHHHGLHLNIFNHHHHKEHPQQPAQQTATEKYREVSSSIDEPSNSGAGASSGPPMRITVLSVCR